jgi:F-type H+-transporting ATPase subunit delta
VAERGRTDHLAVIAEKYHKLLDEDLHRVCAQVHTAVPLTAEARGTLSAKLEHALGGRQVLLEEIVDRTMLGGLKVESGGFVLDASLEGQLEKMRRHLGAGDRS